MAREHFPLWFGKFFPSEKGKIPCRLIQSRPSFRVRIDRMRRKPEPGRTRSWTAPHTRASRMPSCCDASNPLFRQSPATSRATGNTPANSPRPAASASTRNGRTAAIPRLCPDGRRRSASASASTTARATGSDTPNRLNTTTAPPWLRTRRRTLRWSPRNRSCVCDACPKSLAMRPADPHCGGRGPDMLKAAGLEGVS